MIKVSNEKLKELNKIPQKLNDIKKNLNLIGKIVIVKNGKYKGRKGLINDISIRIDDEVNISIWVSLKKRNGKGYICSQSLFSRTGHSLDIFDLTTDI